MNIHPDDMPLFKEAEALAYRLASAIGKSVSVFEAKRRPHAGGADGLCYVGEKRISICFRYRDYAEFGGGWFDKPLPREHVLGVVAHEVAHLPHPNHGKEFRELEAKLKGMI